MAIINSYPTVTPKATDLLLISDIDTEGNPTKTVTINSVLALIPPGSGGGGGISSIQSSNSNLLLVTDSAGPIVTLSVATSPVQSAGSSLSTSGDIYNFVSTFVANYIANGGYTNNVGTVTNVTSSSAITALSLNTTDETSRPNIALGIVGTPSNSQFLRGDGTWAVPGGTGAMSNWRITADNGTIANVVDNELVNIKGSAKIDTSASLSQEVTITHKPTTTTANTTTPTQLVAGGTFTALTTVSPSSDGTGHLEAYNTATYTLPAAGAGVSSISKTDPITIDNSTPSAPIIGITEANSTTNGYLSSTKFAEFDAKQTAISLSVNGTSGAATFNSATGALNIPVYSTSGGGGVSSVGLNVSSGIPGFQVTMAGGGPNPIEGSDTFNVGIVGTPGTSKYLDGSGNFSTPVGSISSIAATTSNTASLGVSNTLTSNGTLTLEWQGRDTEFVKGDGSLDSVTIPTQFSWSIQGQGSAVTTVADGSTIQIKGGTTGGITTSLQGNVLTIDGPAASAGTVRSIGVLNSGSLINLTTSENDPLDPITDSGTLSANLAASGTPSITSFLRGDGNWASIIPKTLKGIAQIEQSTTGSGDNTLYFSEIGVEYEGAGNIIKSAVNLSASPSASDTVIINDATDNIVKEVTVANLLQNTIMTSTVRGEAKLFSDTQQTVPANNVSSSTARTYGSQLNNSNQLVVNVPWEETRGRRGLSQTTVTGLFEGYYLQVDYFGNDNIILYPDAQDVNVTPDKADEIIINSTKSGNDVKRLTIERLATANVFTSRYNPATWFGVDSASTAKGAQFVNNGNIDDNTQGLGTIADGFDISGDASSSTYTVTFGTAQTSQENYVVFFTIEEPFIQGGNKVPAIGYIENKTANGFDLKMVPNGVASNQLVKVNFQIYDGYV